MCRSSNGVMAEALRVGGVVAIGGEAAARRVEPVQAAAVGADPQRARLVLLQRRHPRVAQTLGVRGVGRVVHHLPTAPIEAIEAAILRADPETPSWSSCTAQTLSLARLVAACGSCR